LLEFVEDESGNYGSTDKQWLTNFYDYEKYQAGLTQLADTPLSDF